MRCAGPGDSRAELRGEYKPGNAVTRHAPAVPPDRIGRTLGTAPFRESAVKIRAIQSRILLAAVLPVTVIAILMCGIFLYLIILRSQPLSWGMKNIAVSAGRI
jgi:hypothetical protein